MKKITEDILWDFADQLLPNDQQKEIEILIANDPALQKQLDAILQQKTLFSSTEMEQPNVDFSSTLLEKWAIEQETQTVENTQLSGSFSLLKIIFTSFVFMSIGLIYFTFSQNTVSEPLPIEIPNIEIPWSKMYFILVSILALLSVRFIEKWIVFRRYSFSV
jgi:hypothetical protein